MRNKHCTRAFWQPLRPGAAFPGDHTAARQRDLEINMGPVIPFLEELGPIGCLGVSKNQETPNKVAQKPQKLRYFERPPPKKTRLAILDSNHAGTKKSIRLRAERWKT